MGTAFRHDGAVSGADGRQAAIDELSKPEYHPDRPSVPQRILEWISDKLGRTVGEAASDGHNLLLFGMIAIIVALTIYLVSRAGRIRRAEKPTQHDWLVPVDEVDHRAAAAGHTAAGEYDLALREWLRDCIRTLESRAIIDPTPGRTGIELARIVTARLPSAAGAFDRAVIAFNEVWFGHREPHTGDAAAGEQAADAIAGAKESEAAAHNQPRYLVPS